MVSAHSMKVDRLQQDLVTHLKCHGPVDFSAGGLVDAIFECVWAWELSAGALDTIEMAQTVVDRAIRQYYNEVLSVTDQPRTQTQMNALEALLDMAGPRMIHHLCVDRNIGTPRTPTCWEHVSVSCRSAIKRMRGNRRAK